MRSLQLRFYFDTTVVRLLTDCDSTTNARPAICAVAAAADEFLPRDAMRRLSAVFAVARCPSVRPFVCVTLVNSIQRLKIS